MNPLRSRLPAPPGPCSRRGTLRQRRSRPRRYTTGCDAGTTLLEVTVGVVLMSIFMAMFTGAVVMMTKAVNTSQAINETASQVAVAFREVDETVRTASFVSTPHQGTDQNWQVEMLSRERDGTLRCTQLRVDSVARELQRRTWTDGSSDRGDWTTLASGIANGGPGTATPFALKEATDVPAVFQQLVVTLIPEAGPGISAGTVGSSFTVTALNSGATQAGTAAPPASTCSGAGP